LRLGAAFTLHRRTIVSGKPYLPHLNHTQQCRLIVLWNRCYVIGLVWYRFDGQKATLLPAIRFRHSSLCLCFLRVFQLNLCLYTQSLVYDRACTLTTESVVHIVGYLAERPQNMINEKMPSGIFLYLLLF
jgi:hypothetical protein